MLPWVWTGLRSSPALSEAQRHVDRHPDHPGADHDRDPEERVHQIHDLARRRARRMERVLTIFRPGGAAAREHDDEGRHADGCHGPAPEPFHAVQHLPSLEEPGRRECQRAATLHWRIRRIATL
jgi:hypothetical protein